MIFWISSKKDVFCTNKMPSILFNKFLRVCISLNCYRKHFSQNETIWVTKLPLEGLLIIQMVIQEYN